MNLLEFVSIGAAIANIIAAIIVAFSLREVKRDVRVATHLNMTSQVTNIDMLLMQDRELAKELNYSELEPFAFIVLNNLEDRYLLQRERVFDKGMREANRQVMQRVASLGFVQDTWEKYKGDYHPKFIKYFDPIISGARASVHSHIAPNDVDSSVKTK